MIQFENLQEANKPFEHLLRRAFERVLGSGRYILGDEVKMLEAEFAQAFGHRHAVGVGSGYDALLLAFAALGITQGEVIVPANTYMATILAVIRSGLTPVLCDPDPETLLLDPASAEKLITPRTVAILPVHLYGLVCDMEGFSRLARNRSLALVEDCAQAHGGSFRERFVGNFGDAGAFSFYPTKNLGGLGDGGMVTTGDAATAEAVRTLRNYGSKERAVAERVGMNSRLDELQAAFLREKLPYLAKIVEHKNALAKCYDDHLAPCFARPAPVAGARSARSLYVIRSTGRERLREYLHSKNIFTDVHYPVPPHRHRAIAPLVSGEFPVSDRLSAEILSLPLSYGHSEREIYAVIEAMNDFSSL